MVRASRRKIHPKRGEVWLVSLDPVVGSEIGKTRPAIIISNSVANKHLTRCQIIPVTSNTEKVYPSECLITIKSKSSKAAVDQIRTTAKERLVKKISTISPQELAMLELVMRVHLGL